MPPLENNILKAILLRINNNPHLKEKFKSEWKSLLVFLRNNCGIKFEAVLRLGTIGKETDIVTSDFDIIFSPTPYTEREALYSTIINAFHETFPKDKIEIMNDSVQVRLKNGNKIDLISVSQEEFDQKFNNLKNTRQISNTTQNAVKLVKYAISNSGFSHQIRGSLIEALAINIDPPELSICVETILNQMRKKKLATLKTFKHIRGLLERIPKKRDLETHLRKQLGSNKRPFV